MLLYLVILAISAACYLLKRNNEYWEKKGVPGPKPILILGNMKDSFLMRKTPTLIYNDIYKQYPDAPIIGVYRASTPTLIIKDPDLLKEVMIKSFNHFHDNDFHITKESDPIFGRNPFVLRGEAWRITRTQLTPAFTSGKMKWVYPHLEENTKEMIKYLENEPRIKKGEGYEAKELCVRLTLNNVATCAFGLDGNCFKEDNSEFRQISQDFLTPGGYTLTIFFLITLIPAIAKVVPLRFIQKSVEKRLIEIVSQTIKYRKENKIIRNDFLQFMIQLQNTCKEHEFTDLDVTAQASGFFADGSDSSAMIMSFLLYNIAAHQEVQSKIRKEVVKAFKENNNELPYEAVVNNMQYLDAVFAENQRMYPGMYSLQKVCTKDYTYILNGKPVVIEKGTPIVIPLYGLHNDTKYFENPETFNPERFLGQNKEKIRKCTFMPFGEGPRSCLGQRFGTLQIKVGIAYILKNFILTVNPKTIQPLQIDPVTMLMNPIGGLWLDFKKIS